MTLSYCEPVTATSASPWCIRRLTDRGQMLSGGVDTSSLCGRVRAGWGWDLPVEVTEPYDRYACKRCLKVLLELENE